MRFDESEEGPSDLVWIALIIVAALLWWVGTSHFEARAYERITGKHVSTLDAMFVALRVQAEAK
jgi:hypothetical protein